MSQKPVIIILVGVSGDLSKRKLLPALTQLFLANVLPQKIKIIGVTRRLDVTLEPLLENVVEKDFLRSALEIYTMDLDEEAAYSALQNHIESLEEAFGAPSDHLFYLSVPPQVSRPIIEFLGKVGLNSVTNSKLMVEKPFGVDLATAQDLITHIDTYFTSDQVYRIDHYVAKEMAQNIAIFRDGSSLFKRTWNNTFIEAIEIRATEAIGIEGRATFYEQTGALRDLIQSHLMALTALTLMDTPTADLMAEIPHRRLAILKTLQVSTGVPVLASAKRGQYNGYAMQAENPGSNVETFASIILESSDLRWTGVPITLTTGKALSEKATEIRITYRKDEPYEADQLVLRLQPNEGVSLSILNKTPGYENEVNQQTLSFNYREHYNESPEGYERVFLDAIQSDHRLFTTSAEVLETWRILAPIQAAWKTAGKNGLKIYDQGATVETITNELVGS